ncbi:AAA family ATPase [Nocardia sp. NPDC049526]|uniref:AAA family ATPase n=1 Tax=Nocardia sp. NPDC049526 TaxID=3364316 RepID=UPI0037957703
MSRIADRIQHVRRQRFVGRTAETALFRAALTTESPLFSAVFVHGAGGVGKTALLRVWGEIAEAAGAVTVRVDARSVEPSPVAFLSALGAALGLAAGRSPVDALAGGPRHVLLLDTYDLLAPIDEWIRERFLPELPGTALVVMASRDPPSPEWTSDPEWRESLRSVPLRNLSPAQARSYLRVEKVPETLHDQVLAATHGHPLALSLLVDVIRQHDQDHRAITEVDLRDTPDVVRVLLERIIAAVPSPRHRRALEVCAHTRVTTEEMLRAVLGGDDAGELFSWLRRLSFVEEGEAGVFPHELARDVIDADLQWRDRAGYTAMHRRVRRHVLGHIRHDAGRAQQQAVADLVFLQRVHPPIRAFMDWSSLGRHYPDALAPGDREALLDMTWRWQGPESAELVAYWLDRQPHAFVIVRGDGGSPLGFGARLRLHEATAADLSADPGANAMWEYAQRHGPPQPGEEVLASRFFMDCDLYQQPSPSFTVITIGYMQRSLANPRMRWDFLGGYENVDPLSPLFSYIDYHRAPEADYQVGDRHYQVVARDCRHGLEAWLDLLAEREVTGYDPSTSPVAHPVPAITWSRPEFREAVRQALRDLHRIDKLAQNPLLRTRQVQNQSGATSAATALAGIVRQAAETLREDPRDAKLFRAIDRTYLRPAVTQERAAEVLGLPFSTYRRHLSAGVSRIVDLLWQREVHGSREPGLHLRHLATRSSGC